MNLARRGRLHAERFRNALRERIELHRAQELQQRVRVRVFHGGKVERLMHGDMLLQLDQPARQPRLVGEFDQRLAALVLLDLGRMGQQRFEVAIARGSAPPRSSRRCPARPARYRRCRRQRLDIHHLLGRHAELLDHLGRADGLVLHGVEHGHAGRRQAASGPCRTRRSLPRRRPPPPARA